MIMKKHNIGTSQRGFTLIELLVVVAVVVVLTGVLVFAIKPDELLKKGRDARRMTDLENLSKAITLGLAEGEITLVNTTACTVCTSQSGSPAVDGTGFVKYTVPASKVGLAKYMPTLPLDPKNTGNLLYKFASDGSSYEFDAVLESADNVSKMTTDGGNAPGVYEVGSSLTLL